MAKKTKSKTGWYRPLIEVTSVVWEWQCGQWQWRYSSHPGINLFLSVKGGAQGVAFCKDIKEAGMFAEGFAAGAHVQAVIAATEKKEAEALATSNESRD